MMTLENKPELVQISATPAANEISEPSAVQAPPAPPPPTPTPEPAPPPPSGPAPSPPQATPASPAAASAPAAEAPEGAPSDADLEEESVDDVATPAGSVSLPSEAQDRGLNQDQWAMLQDARRQLRDASDPNLRAVDAEDALADLQAEDPAFENLNVSDLIQSSAAIKQIDRRKYI